MSCWLELKLNYIRVNGLMVCFVFWSGLVFCLVFLCVFYIVVGFLAFFWILDGMMNGSICVASLLVVCGF